MLFRNRIREDLGHLLRCSSELKETLSMEKIIRGGLILLFFTLPLVFFIKNSGFCITKESYAEILVLALITPWGVQFLEKRKSPPCKDIFFLPIAVFGIFLILSLLWTVGTYDSLRELAIWGVYLAVFFLITSVVKTEKTVKLLLLSILSASFIASVYAIFQFYNIDFSFWIQRGGRSDIFSTFGNPNYLAGYLAPCIPVSVILLLLAKRWWKKSIYGGFVVIPFIAILMTSTRGGWVALFVSLVVTLIISYRWLRSRCWKTNKILLPALLGILVFLAIMFSFPNLINQGKTNVAERAVTATNFQQSTIKQRALMWLSSLEIIKENPFLGSGLGTYIISYPEAQGRVLSRESNRAFIPSAVFTKHAHNEYLQIPSEIGIIGLILFIWIVVTFYSRILRLKTRLRKEDRVYLVIVIAISTAILTHSMFSFPFRIVQNGLLFWLCLGIVVVMTKNRGLLKSEKIVVEKEQAIEANPKSARFCRVFTKRAAQVALVSGAIFVGSLVLNIFVADMHLTRGRMWGILGESEKSRKELEKARQMDPYNGQICRFLGELYNELGEYERAIDTFQQARLNWVYPHLYSNLGYAHYELWQLDKAGQALEKNIYIHPNISDSYLNLGKVYLRWAQKHWQSGEYSLLEDELDRASFYFEQAQAFKPGGVIPKELAELYCQVGRQLNREKKKGEGSPQVGRERQQEIELPRGFYFPQKEEILDVLPLTSKSDNPLYFKIFYYQPAGLEKKKETWLEIMDKEGNPVRKMKTNRICLFSDKTAVLAYLMNSGLEPGEYSAQARITRTNSDLISKKRKFRVVEKDLPLGTISEFEVKVSPDKRKFLGDLTFENGTDEFLGVLGQVEIINSQGGMITAKDVAFRSVPPGKEEKIPVAIEYNFPPGLYQARAIIIYQGNKIARFSRYFMVSSAEE